MIRITSGGGASAVFGPLVVGAARTWFHAREKQRATQPELYRFLVRQDGGMLVPVLDSVFRLYEACLRREFRAGQVADQRMTSDELRLLELLAKQEPADLRGDVSPGLVASLGIALRSARMMLAGVAGVSQRAWPSGPDVGQPANDFTLRHASWILSAQGKRTGS